MIERLRALCPALTEERVLRAAIRAFLNEPYQSQNHDEYAALVREEGEEYVFDAWAPAIVAAFVAAIESLPEGLALVDRRYLPAKRNL